jgi:hypothetical protein
LRQAVQKLPPFFAANRTNQLPGHFPPRTFNWQRISVVRRLARSNSKRKNNVHSHLG